MSYKIFIDGESGTTGLEIKQRLSKVAGVDILSIDPNVRKNIGERLNMFARSDLVFLCLPDSDARTIMLKADPEIKVIDASTAHRTADNWVYGMPELSSEQRQKIKESNRVANPGCHATGFILLVRPLIDAGIIPEDAFLNFHSITGYSGGGKEMIWSYEGRTGKLTELKSPRQYALTQDHKHLPEIQTQSRISISPVFSPIVGDFYKGMLITIPLHGKMLKKRYGPLELVDFYRKRYKCDPLILVKDIEDVSASGFVDADGMAGHDNVEITVSGNNQRMTLMARYDNLGKGASGAAIQNMNIMLGLPELEGLQIKKDGE